jgi:gas vesicle protein
MSSNDYETETNDCVDGGGHVLTSVLAGAVIGVLVGGGIALLFAPKPGADLRTDLGGAVDDIRDKAEQLLDDLQGSTQELVTRSRTILDQTRENLVRSVEAGKDAYAQKRDELSAQLDA